MLYSICICLIKVCEIGFNNFLIWIELVEILIFNNFFNKSYFGKIVGYWYDLDYIIKLLLKVSFMLLYIFILIYICLYNLFILFF